MASLCDTFTAHKNNPIFTNDYSNPYENEHLGGNLKLIKTDSLDYLFYQGKSSFSGLKYNVMLREGSRIENTSTKLSVTPKM